MTVSARSHILASIKRALDTRSSLAARADNVERRIQRRRENTRPARATTAGAARVEQFVRAATAAGAEVVRIADAAAIPATVGALAKDEKAFACAPALKQLDWGAAGLAPRFGPARPEGTLGLSLAWAAVAETGTLVLLSGPESPVTLNFLPDVHGVVLAADAIDAGYEDTWSRLRARPTGDRPTLPRTVNWITGPSRTADIEQTILLGAHGPRRLVIVLVDGKATP